VTATLAERASLRWHVLAKATMRRSTAIEARVRLATLAATARAHRVTWNHASRNRYGVRVDHLGRGLFWNPNRYCERRRDANS